MLPLKQKQPIKLYVIGSIVCILFVVVAFIFLQRDQEEELQLLEDFSSEESNESLSVAEEETVEIVIKVDVKGAVVRPGLYMAKPDDRVLDLIEQAGSFTEEADQNGVNLAQRVEDQMVIYVPTIGEEATSVNTTSSLGNSGGTVAQDGKININQATAAELETITGIGPSKANAILQYREENGTFKSIEELKNISGIGDKTFEKLKDEITI